MAKLTKQDIESGKILKVVYTNFFGEKNYKVSYKIGDVVYITKIVVFSPVVSDEELKNKIYLQLTEVDKRVPIVFTGTTNFDIEPIDLQGITIFEPK